MVYAILILTLIASAVFSGLEIAFVSRNKLQAELEKGSGSSKNLEEFYEHPARFISTTLMGNNIALVIFGMCMSVIVAPGVALWLPEALQNEFVILMIETLITTAVVLVFGEFLPKNLFRHFSNQALNFFATPFRIIYYLLIPFTFIANKLSNFILKHFFRLPFKESKPVFTVLDIGDYIKSVYNTGDDQIDQMVERTIELDETKVRECLIPRREIQAIEDGGDFEQIRQRFIKSKHSRMPVYKGSIDKIIGYYHHHDLLKKKPIIYPMEKVPETTPANDLLDKFIKEKLNMVWVVDEYGGTAGIVTLEDLIEEIFGEIHDEYDETKFTEEKINDKTYRFSARLEIDYLNEKYKLNIPDDLDCETLAGFIQLVTGRIPETGEEIKVEDFVITISDAEGPTINEVVFELR